MRPSVNNKNVVSKKVHNKNVLCPYIQYCRDMDLLVFTPSHMNLSESSDIYQFLLLHFRIYKTLDDT